MLFSINKYQLEKKSLLTKLSKLLKILFSYYKLICDSLKYVVNTQEHTNLPPFLCDPRTCPLGQALKRTTPECENHYSFDCNT